ncbi:MAG: transglutaminase domain-containing protein [Bacillota bacterium]|nr:transglutaminase domain-containing protein [Bacillota bacterium]
MKKYFRLMIRAAVVALIIPFVLSAQEACADDVQTFQSQWINPVYEDVIDASDLKEIEVHQQEQSEDGLTIEGPSVSRQGSSGSAGEYTSISDAAAAVRKQMKTRSSEITVCYKTKTNEDYQTVANEIFTKALSHTGVPTEGDYLEYQIGGYTGNVLYGKKDAYYFYSFTFDVLYFTTAEQEADMNTAVSELISSLSLEDKSDYVKVKRIYDYLCSNVTYDYDNLGDESYLLQYTAYAALVDKTAVCQGYANLFYRLALEAGVDARIIRGTSGGVGHAWNIAQLGNKYYYMDSTWDAGKSTYSYFLKGSNNFSGHTLDSFYSETGFFSNYPLSAVDYTGICDEHVWKSNYIVLVAPSYTETGQCEKTCRVCGIKLKDGINRLAIASPANVTADLYGYDDFYIKWNASKGATGYYVYYKKSGGSWGKPLKTSYTNTKISNLEDGVKYYFRVIPYASATNGVEYKGSAGDSTGVYTLKKLSKPSIKKKSSKYITIKWTNIPGESGYQIASSKSKSKGYKVVKTVSSKYKSCSIKATKKKTYYYKIRAYKTVNNKKVYGPWSSYRSYKLK